MELAMKLARSPVASGLALALLVVSSASSTAHTQARPGQRVALPAQRAPVVPPAELDGEEESVPSVPVVLEGVVLDANGAPAAGATVTSSAGGRAVTSLDGRYRLEARMPLDAESAVVMAAGGSSGELTSLTSVWPSSGTTPVETLVL